MVESEVDYSGSIIFLEEIGGPGTPEACRGGPWSDEEEAGPSRRPAWSAGGTFRGLLNPNRSPSSEESQA